MKFFDLEFVRNNQAVISENFFTQKTNDLNDKKLTNEISPEDYNLKANLFNTNDKSLVNEILTEQKLNFTKNAHDIERLNKTKVHLIARKLEKDENGRQTLGILPICSYDRLCDHDLSRLILHRDVSLRGIFTDEMNESEQRNSANRSFLLEGLITPGPSNDGVLKPSLKALDIKEKIRILVQLDDEIFLIEVPDDKEEEKRFLLGLDEYEYEEGELDTIYANPQKYFSAEWKQEHKNKKYENEEGNGTIIPIFLDLEAAQNFLKITLQEVLEPYKKKKLFTRSDDLAFMFDNFRIFEGDYEVLTNSNRFITAIGTDEEIYQARNINYLDDQISHVTKIFSEKWINKVRNWLAERRWIKPLKYIGGYDTKSYLSRPHKILFNSVLKTEIITIGLGDFLNLYNEELTNSEILQNNELLFVPSTKDFQKQNRFLKSSKFDFNKKISSEPFFNYQKKFHNLIKRNHSNDFIYKIDN